MFFDKFDPTALPLEGARNEPRISQWQNFQAAQRAFNYVDAGQASSQALRDIWEPIIDEINQATGSDFWSPTDALNIGIGISAAAGAPESRYRYQAERVLNHIQQNRDSLPEEITSLTLDRFDELAIERAQQSITDLEFAAEDRPGLLDDIVRILGGFSAGATDSTNVPYLALGSGGKTLTSFAFREAVINAGAEAALQPSVAEWYEAIGLPYTIEDFFRNVGYAAVGGAVFAVGVRGAARGVELASDAAAPFAARVRGVPRSAFETARFLDNAEPSLEVMLNNEQLRQGIRILEDAGVRLSREAKTALDVAQALDELDQDNPGINPSDHAERTAQAEEAIARGNIPNIPDLRPEEINPAATRAQPRPTGGVIFEYDPRDIQVDAQTFQFKTGGDALGVTERLQGVTEWDPYLAGVITVYEYRDGSTFVADGHQRLGLAKRLLEENPDANIRISAYRIRETDGITPQEAMVTAAIKNIAEGTGTAIDAARILRLDPDRLTGLPPRSQLVRQARDMMELTDESFGAIINEVIPANYGAVVGRVLGDRPELQRAAIEVLAKSEPANVFQAEAIVRQVREADADQVTQISLFGEEIVTESLYAERARILDRAFKALRRDRAAFESLTRNADRIESEGGNVLDRQANERRAEQNAQIIALLQTLANRKGPLSDALSGAARQARDTGSYVSATNGFVDAVRRSIAEGDFDRISSSELGRTGDAPAEISRRSITEERAVESFDEPNGTGVEEQADQLTVDMFGTEPEAAPVARTAQDIEADLKARQPVQTVDDIYALADDAQAYIARIGDEIAADLDVEFKNPGLKKIEEARSKMQRKGYTSANQMTDVSRAGFIANTAEQANEISRRFGKDAEILDEGWSIAPTAFADRKILVRTPSGIISEIQIWSPEMYKAKFSADNKFGQRGQDLYTEWRNATDENVRMDLTQKQRELYSDALNREDQSFKEVFGISKLPKVPENLDLNEASSGIILPVSQTSAASTPTQLPPGSSMATASIGEYAIAGRPSQLTSSIVDTSKMDIDIGSRPVNPDRLFDDIETNELMEGIDLDEEISLDVVVNPETGEPAVATVTMRDVRRMVEEEDAIIQRLEFCTR